MNERSISPKDNWAHGVKYEAYMGRWSRLMAREFLSWLNVPAGKAWLDVGCGTGALSQTILQIAAPAKVKGIDQSDGFIAFAKEQVQDSKVEFEVGDAMSLNIASGEFDTTVSGLVLNFIPKPERTISEMARVTHPGGIAAAYVWDYAGKMEFIRYFFNAAKELDPKAAEVDEGPRFPICQPDVLGKHFEAAGLHQVEVNPIEIPTTFRNFDDYWNPFLGGQGPTPAYTLSLNEENRAELRECLRKILPVAEDGSIPLIARAWAVRGIR